MRLTDVCTLAATGGDSTMLIVLAGLLLLAGAIALVTARRSRRSRGLTLGAGALAVVGALVLAPLGGVTPAQAALDHSCPPAVTAPVTPSPTSSPGDDVIVTPLAPSITTVACGVSPEVVIPVVDGVSYETSQVVNVVTVEAIALSGFAFATDATTVWSFDLTPQPCACVPAEIPWADPATTLSADRASGTVLGLPAGVAQSLADAGATFSVSVAWQTGLVVTWTANPGPLPAGVETGDVVFEGDEISTGSNGVVTPAGGVQFAFTTTGETATAKSQAALAALQAQYPDAGIGLQVWSFGSSNEGVFTVTVEDSCGDVQSRDYRIFNPGGGGGGV